MSNEQNREDLEAYLKALEDMALNFTRISEPEDWTKANDGTDCIESTVRLPATLKPYLDSIDEHVERMFRHTIHSSITGKDILRDLLSSLIYTGLLQVAETYLDKEKAEKDALVEENPNVLN